MKLRSLVHVFLGLGAILFKKIITPCSSLYSQFVCHPCFSKCRSSLFFQGIKLCVQNLTFYNPLQSSQNPLFSSLRSEGTSDNCLLAFKQRQEGRRQVEHIILSGNDKCSNVLWLTDIPLSHFSGNDVGNGRDEVSFFQSSNFFVDVLNCLNGQLQFKTNPKSPF